MNQNTDPRVAEAIRVMKEDSGRWKNPDSFTEFTKREDSTITRDYIIELINNGELKQVPAV